MLTGEELTRRARSVVREALRAVIPADHKRWRERLESSLFTQDTEDG